MFVITIFASFSTLLIIRAALTAVVLGGLVAAAVSALLLLTATTRAVLTAHALARLTLVVTALGLAGSFA